MITTLDKIRTHSPCKDGWGKLLEHLGKTQADDEPLNISVIAENIGFHAALWCLRAVDGEDRKIRLYAVWCARRVQHLMTDPRGLAALDVAKRFANDEATDSELTAARGAAWDASCNPAQPATASRAAYAAHCAADDVAANAAYNTAEAAATAAAREAVDPSAGDDAWDAEAAAQLTRLLEICK
jgi:hypothetical protein